MAPNQAMNPLLILSAVLMAVAPLAEHDGVRVISVQFRDDSSVHSANPGSVRRGWYSHSTDAEIKTLIRLLPGEKIPRSSVWVRETTQSLTLCFELAYDRTLQSVQRTIMLRARVTGLPLNDPRPVDASGNCGRMPTAD